MGAYKYNDENRRVKDVVLGRMKRAFIDYMPLVLIILVVVEYMANISARAATLVLRRGLIYEDKMYYHINIPLQINQRKGS